MSSAPIKLLAFAASFRKDSFNKKLLNIAAEHARKLGAEVDLADFSEFDMPLYSADMEAMGFPLGAEKLKNRIEAADGLILASPEYNFSIPGTIKNAIDWVSRFRPVPFRGRTGLLLAASPGMVGGIRGLWHLRVPLEGLGMFVYPDMYTVPEAGEAFDEAGTSLQLKDAHAESRLAKLVGEYIRTTGALRRPG